MFSLFKKKETSLLTSQVSASILAEFMHWYGKEIDMYEGAPDRCMLFNIATLHPHILKNPEIGLEHVKRYFVMSTEKDQRFTTRLQIFVTKMKLVFGAEVIHELEARCIRCLLEDYRFDQKVLDLYLRTAELFWTYPILLIQANLDLAEIQPGTPQNPS